MIHNCVGNALHAAGVEIPDHYSVPLPIEQAPALCAELGLEWYSEAAAFTVGQPLIVFVLTRPGWAHAVFTRDARGIDNIVGVISFP